MSFLELASAPGGSLVSSAESTIKKYIYAVRRISRSTEQFPMNTGALTEWLIIRKPRAALLFHIITGEEINVHISVADTRMLVASYEHCRLTAVRQTMSLLINIFFRNFKRVGSGWRSDEL